MSTDLINHRRPRNPALFMDRTSASWRYRRRIPRDCHGALGKEITVLLSRETPQEELRAVAVALAALHDQKIADVRSGRAS